MGIKQGLASSVRRIFPKHLVASIETVYRRLRVQLVSFFYGYPAKHARVVAITGTNGKTTTAHFVNEILKETGLTTAMFSTATIEVDGKSRSNTLNATVAHVAQMQKFFKRAKQKQVDYVIIEATSHALHQHKLDTIPVEVAIMTNLTQDHLDYHQTMKKYAAAKGLLFQKKPKFIVLNHDDGWFSFFDKFEAGSQKITYGTDENADAKIKHARLYRKGSEVKLVIDHQTELKLASALPGKYNVYNAVAAATAAYIMGIKRSDIVEGIANLEAVAGRFEYVKTDKPFDIIVDYAHTSDALDKLLQAVKAVTKNRVILVFGACGDRDQAKRPIMGEVAAKLADRIVLTDEESYNEDPTQIREMIYRGIKANGGSAKTNEVADRRQAIDKALSIAKRGDTVLVTGMGHEQFRIVEGKRLPWNDSTVIRELASESAPRQ